MWVHLVRGECCCQILNVSGNSLLKLRKRDTEWFKQYGNIHTTEVSSRTLNSYQIDTSSYHSLSDRVSMYWVRMRTRSDTIGCRNVDVQHNNEHGSFCHSTYSDGDKMRRWWRRGSWALNRSISRRASKVLSLAFLGTSACTISLPTWISSRVGGRGTEVRQ